MSGSRHVATLLSAAALAVVVATACGPRQEEPAPDAAMCDALLRDGAAGVPAATRLIEREAAEVDRRIPTEGGATCTMLVAQAGIEDGVRMLLEHGADPDLEDDRGRTALAYAADPAIVRLLLGAGADPGHRDHDGTSALDLARERGDDEIVALLEAELPGR